MFRLRIIPVVSLFSAMVLIPSVGFSQDSPNSNDGFAQADDSDDVLDEILSGSEDTSVKDERAAVLREDPVVSDKAPPPKAKKKRAIKTLQRKSFLKIGRYEAGPPIGFVTNDPFITPKHYPKKL